MAGEQEMARHVIVFEADTSKVDAAIDRIEQRIGSIVASFGEIRIKTPGESPTTPTQAVQAVQAVSPIQQESPTQRTQEDLLRDVKEQMEEAVRALQSIEEAIQSANKPG